MAVLATESILNFLQAKVDKGEHNGPDLIQRYMKYGCNMETQVNVSAGEGEPVDGKRSTYTDGIDTWFSFRIPKGAYDEPHFKDFYIRFPLDVHCEGIGSTGWDWQSRRSRWVAFDFDAISGHAEGVGIEDEELQRVKDAACNLPYVEVRKSTGGAGLHLYVYFEDRVEFDTSNHNEHAAMARAVLGVMSRDAGYPFAGSVDVCGGNMWIWHTKSGGTPGLELVKSATAEFTSEELPSNWRDHQAVVTRSSRKLRLPDIGDAELDPFDQLASAHRQVMLDQKHKDMMDEISAAGFACNWISDHWLLQTHTCGFKHIFENHKERFEIKGVFDTNSRGGDPLEANCFAFPLDNGAWKIVRFGAGTNEHPTWQQDGAGWTTCFFNVSANLDTAARSLGGRPLEKGGYEFDSLNEALEVARMLHPEGEFVADAALANRKAVVRKSKDGNIAVEMPKNGSNEQRPEGDWTDTNKKSVWTQLLPVAAEPTIGQNERTDYDKLIRCMTTEDGQQSGWAMHRKTGGWLRKTASSIKMYLQYLGHAKAEAEEVMGLYEHHPWTIVTRPFEPEYLSNRRWNVDAPQYRFDPAPRIDAGTDENQGEDSQHPHWDLIFDHVGDDLTKYLRELDWAKTYGVRTGADYLRAIFASILREPFEPTPYLFLFGPENSGKSILHEAFELLVTKGVVKADRALTSQSNFNGELANAIMCVVEETDVAKSPGAHSKIKDFVTSRRVSIRRMRTDSYMIDNMTHWIQCANDIANCPVFDGDTRITMIFVDELPEGAEIPKSLLMQKLEEEAPHLMRTLLDMTLPPPSGRLRIPIVSTQYKQHAEDKNRSSLLEFIKECVHPIPGELLPFAEFYERFIEWLPNEEKGAWSRQRVSKELPTKFATGRGTANKTFITNSSFVLKEASEPACYVLDGKIKRETNG